MSEKTKGYKKNLRELIATFGEFRDSQLQKETAKRKAEQSEKAVLSDTGSDQGRGCGLSARRTGGPRCVREDRGVQHLPQDQI